MTTDTMPSDERPADAPRVPFPLQSDERVIQLVRKHWLYLWPRAVLMVLFALVPVSLIAFALSWAGQYDGIVAKIFWIVAAVWMLYWFARILLNWYRYHNDIWVITNQRIVDSLKTTPFSHRLSTADLVNVQDMTVERNGILHTMFNYGNIICQTAATGGDFTLVGIPRPDEVQLLVDKERDRERMRGR